MKKKLAIFFDRDGTLIEDKGYLSSVQEVQFYKETVPALNLLKNNFLFFIITNQSGIGRGLTTEEEVEQVNNYLLSYLKSESLEIEEIFICPHISEDHCQCKKPSPYFIKLAAEKYNIDVQKSYIIGDHPSDIECGMNAGLQSLYVLTGHGTKHVAELNRKTLQFKNILDAANYINIKKTGK